MTLLGPAIEVQSHTGSTTLGADGVVDEQAGLVLISRWTELSSPHRLSADGGDTSATGREHQLLRCVARSWTSSLDGE